jgi:hypothetical protein
MQVMRRRPGTIILKSADIAVRLTIIISVHRPGHTPLVSCQASVVIAGIDGWAGDKQSARWCWPTIVAK